MRIEVHHCGPTGWLDTRHMLGNESVSVWNLHQSMDPDIPPPNWPSIPAEYNVSVVACWPGDTTIDADAVRPHPVKVDGDVLSVAALCRWQPAQRRGSRGVCGKTETTDILWQKGQMWVVFYKQQYFYYYYYYYEYNLFFLLICFDQF